MADYTYNCDKWNTSYVAPLYNSVLSKEFSNETAEPITLQEAKDWGKIDQDTDDTIISALITAARKMCESYSGIGFVNRDIVLGINNSNGGFFLPYGPVVGTPTATNVEGTDETLTYNVGQIQAPYGNMVVSYNAGYLAADFPEDLKTALRCQILYLYENRGEGSQGLSPISKMILEPLRAVV